MALGGKKPEIKQVSKFAWPIQYEHTRPSWPFVYRRDVDKIKLMVFVVAGTKNAGFGYFSVFINGVYKGGACHSLLLFSPPLTTPSLFNQEKAHPYFAPLPSNPISPLCTSAIVNNALTQASGRLETKQQKWNRNSPISSYDGWPALLKKVID